MTNPLLHYITRFKNWFAGIPAAQRFQRQHPTVSGFISDRLDTEQFVGLPLTFLLIVGVVNIMLLSELAESVVDAEWVVVVDQEFTNLLFSMRSDWLSVIMFGLTQLGEQIAVFAIGGLATLIFLFRKRYWALVAFWLAMGALAFRCGLRKHLSAAPVPPMLPITRWSIILSRVGMPLQPWRCLVCWLTLFTGTTEINHTVNL
nr:hypothetical protein [Pontibacter pudoricolor]